MKMDFGTDFRLAGDDVIFTPEGDIETISGPSCVAQDVDQTLRITPGRLVWDRSEGSSLMLMLNASGSNPSAVTRELERVAIADKRVDPVSVKATQKTEKEFRLEFRPMHAVTPAVLEYDLSRGDTGNA